jgi:4-carboxymuconolactone decarboxylase
MGELAMFRWWAFIWLFGAMLVATPALAEQRLPTIPPDRYTADQKKAAEEFLAARKVPVFGPFEPMMHSPEVMNLARSMGDYLRYHSSVGNTLSELIILITAREWSQDYEWYVHYARLRSKQGSPKALQMRSPMAAGRAG